MKKSNTNLFSENKSIEQHPAWKGDVDLQAIVDILSEQHSFTYILSKAESNAYFLSYVRGSDRKIIQIHFEKIFNKKSNCWGYQNATNIICSSLEAFIRYKIKGKGIACPTNLMKLSA